MRHKTLSPYRYERAAECLKALAHPKRLMLLRLMSRGRYSVGELAEQIGVASHIASEHLRLLERCGFVRAERDGQIRYYEITEPHVLNLLECVESRFSEE